MLRGTLRLTLLLTTSRGFRCHLAISITLHDTVRLSLCLHLCSHLEPCLLL
jgi:hypothetical protein